MADDTKTCRICGDEPGRKGTKVMDRYIVVMVYEITKVVT